MVNIPDRRARCNGKKQLLHERADQIVATPSLVGPVLEHVTSNHDYSMSSSARAKIDGGTVSPNSFAVFTFTTSSNLAGCSTGRFSGLAPLRILSTNTAARLKNSDWSAQNDIKPPDSTASRSLNIVGNLCLAASSTIDMRCASKNGCTMTACVRARAITAKAFSNSAGLATNTGSSRTPALTAALSISLRNGRVKGFVDNASTPT